MPNLKEHQFIDSIAKRWGGHSQDILVGIGDDGSVIKSPGQKLCWVQDMMIEGTHFLIEELSAVDLGHKALAVNLSDIAAMGATPSYFQVSLGLTQNQDQQWLDGFYEGMLALANQFGAKLIGGDLSHSKTQLTIDVSLLGHVERAIARTPPHKGWKDGDGLWLCGPLGCAKAGREVLQNGRNGFSQLTSTYRRPHPQLEASKELRSIAESIALIDVSDGLVSEAEHLLKNQNLGLIIDERLLPIHPELAQWAKERGTQTTDYALWGGEDYALLAIAPKDLKLPHSFIEIGHCSTKVKGVHLKNQQDQLRPISSERGWNAFS